MTENDVAILRERSKGGSPRTILAWALDAHHPGIALAASFSKEDIVLAAILTELRPDARVFALDTGRLNEETYEAAEAGPVAFELSPGFTDRLGRGEQVVVRLRTADQLEKLARLAFGHDLMLSFRRDEDGAKAKLFRRREEPIVAYDEGGPII